MRASRAVKLMLIFMRQSFSTPSDSGELVDPYPTTSWLSLLKTYIPIEWNGEYFAPAPSTTEDPVWSTAFRSWQKSDAVKLSSRMSAFIVRSIWSRLCLRDLSMSSTTGVLGNPRYLVHQFRCPSLLLGSIRFAQTSGMVTRTVRHEISKPASNAKRASPIRFLGERSMVRGAPWGPPASFSVSGSNRSSSESIGWSFLIS